MSEQKIVCQLQKIVCHIQKSVTDIEFLNLNKIVIVMFFNDIKIKVNPSTVLYDYKKCDDLGLVYLYKIINLHTK